MVKQTANSKRNSNVDSPLEMRLWASIDEQEDEESTRRFDFEILKEAVYSSGDDWLIDEFNRRIIKSHRHAIEHMRSGRQSLTQRYDHSFASRLHCPRTPA
ncbi:hypothetical protein ANCCAN_09930 [Ancylostoma caninum]|uniref:Uncharacterized protein n=1 Tax=Ancylostoma caninum TaxID=29170 RepID=A0A368GME8_ANCCA|nr:hypothetical protein ANCCAN_09930 [Ancylostoma caninum]